MRKWLLPLLISGLIALDQWTKLWTVATIQLGAVRGFLPGLVSLTYLRNYGAAFSILQHQQWLFTLITLVVMGIAIVYLIKNLSAGYLTLTALVLIISGGIGNFIDRLRLGYVIDMIQLDFVDFAIFNVADAYLTVGVLVMFLALWKEETHGNLH